MVVKRRDDPRQGEVWLVTLDPVVGSEFRKTRPCLVVSPDEMNRHLKTVVVAPMTTVLRAYPTRVSISFQGQKGQVAVDQIRTSDKGRLVKRLGEAPSLVADRVAGVIVETFQRP